MFSRGALASAGRLAIALIAAPAALCPTAPAAAGDVAPLVSPDRIEDAP
jgi:hypothetical protein